MYRGEPLDSTTEEALRDVLGDNAARDLSRLQRMTDQLEQRGLVERDEEGMRLTARGLRRIGQKALGDLFARLRRDRFGDHPISRHGQGGEREEDTKPYEFGDAFDLDVRETLMNAVQRDANSRDQRDLRPDETRLRGGRQGFRLRLQTGLFSLRRNPHRPWLNAMCGALCLGSCQRILSCIGPIR